MGGKANAYSSSCLSYNGATGTLSNPGSIQISNTDGLLEAGDVIIYKLSLVSGSPTITLKADAGAAASTTRGTASAFPATLSFTVASNGQWTHVVSLAGSGSISYVTYCGSIPSSGASSDNGYSDMVRSVTRSQTEVLEKNLESRIDAAFQASGARLNMPSAPSTGFAELAAALRERADDPFAMDEDRSRKTSLRELAMLGSFDTSQMVLAAAGTDPAPGVEKRGEQRFDGPFTLWGHGSYVSMENDFNQNGDDRRYDGESWGYTLGFDYKARPNLLTGISVGYVDTDFTTAYNGGGYEEMGWSVAPYVIYRLTERSNISAVVGYGRGDVDRTRSGNVTGDTDSDQWFAALRGSCKSNPIKDVPLVLTGRASLLIARKQVDAFTESDGSRVDKEIANMRRLKPGVEAAYNLAAGDMTVQPFLKADYVYDFTDAVNGDKQAYNLGGGVRLSSGTSGLSGSITTERQFGRNDYDEYSIDGLISYNLGIKRADGTRASFSPYVKSNLDAEYGQQLGTGIKFSDMDGAASVDLGLTHTVYSYEDDEEETVSGRATVGKLRVELQF